MDSRRYSTIDRHLSGQANIRALVSTPLYSALETAGNARPAWADCLSPKRFSPNSHPLLRLCFSIGKTASISKLWTAALRTTVPTDSCGHPAFRSPGATVR